MREEDEEAAPLVRGKLSPDGRKGSSAGSSLHGEDRPRILFEDKMWKDEIDSSSAWCVVLVTLLFAVIPGMLLMLASMRGIYPLWILTLLTLTMGCLFLFLMTHGLVWRYRLANPNTVLILLVLLTLLWALASLLGGLLCRSAYNSWQNALHLHVYSVKDVSLQEARTLQVAHSPSFNTFTLKDQVSAAPEFASEVTQSSGVYCVIPLFETGQKVEKSAVYAFLACELESCSKCATKQDWTKAIVAQSSPYMENTDQAMNAFRAATSDMESKYSVAPANPPFFLSLYETLPNKDAKYHYFLRVFLSNVLAWWLSYVTLSILFVYTLTRKPRISNF